jgi:hypothetical protein
MEHPSKEFGDFFNTSARSIVGSRQPRIGEMCFLFVLFVGMGYCRVFPSDFLVVGWFGFLVWAVFLFVLGWVEWNSIPLVNMAGCWLGWDENGKAWG